MPSSRRTRKNALHAPERPPARAARRPSTPSAKARERRSAASNENTTPLHAPLLAATRVRALQRALLAWFAREKRTLPWRRDRDAYRVWISEAMLQQTRVETVLGYYERFLSRFPSVAALASAGIDDVLAAWSGLGYYRRARTLHAAARAIVERHGGRFPSAREDVLALPGIGPYTAGAVLSIAFDAPEALVDGNVARVFARLFAIEDETGSARFQQRTWELARALVPRAGGAGEWNQALMELGALVCTPRAASCAECPLAQHCEAFASRRVDELPFPKRRAATIDVELVGAWIEDAGRLVLEHRPETGRMAGMWQLPTIELGARGHLAPHEWPASTRLEFGAELVRARHAITHHRIEFVVRRARAPKELPESWSWHALDALGSSGALALTGMTRKALRALQPGRAPLFSTVPNP